MLKKAFVTFLGYSCFLICYPQNPPIAVKTSKDYATVPASNKYKKASPFRRLFMGKNYRKTWATPVQLPVFHLRESGFKIDELGGGQQTKSLRLLDAEGREWALRTIDKDVEGAMPNWLRNTLAQKVTQDMVSAAHPYAPLTITGMAKATGIIVAEPHFFVVPDDPAFGQYRKLFANQVVMLEDRNPTPDKKETESTENVVEHLLKSSTTKINQSAVLKARLLDMLIADWDRHQDQWRWGKLQKGADDVYYAIPRDRDQAYFQSGGLLVKVAQMLSLKHLVGFTHSTRRIKQLNAKSWNFDRTFINELDAVEWQQTIDAFVTALSDDVIKHSVAQLPKEIYPLNGKTLQTKLIHRKNSLPKDAMRYYAFISKYVTVTGSDESERFHITGNKDSILLTVYNLNNNTKKIYERSFKRKETKKLNLVGLGGKDEFLVDEGADAGIRLEIDGGKGEDIVNIKSKIKRKLYDSDADAESYENVMKKFLKIKD